MSPETESKFKITAIIEDTVVDILRFIESYLLTSWLLFVRPKKFYDLLENNDGSTRLTKPFTYLTLNVFAGSICVSIFLSIDLGYLGKHINSSLFVRIYNNFQDVSFPVMLQKTFPIVVSIALVSKCITKYFARKDENLSKQLSRVIYYSAGFQYLLILFWTMVYIFYLWILRARYMHIIFEKGIEYANDEYNPIGVYDIIFIIILLLFRYYIYLAATPILSKSMNKIYKKALKFGDMKRLAPAMLFSVFVIIISFQAAGIPSVFERMKRFDEKLLISRFLEPLFWEVTDSNIDASNEIISVTIVMHFRDLKQDRYYIIDKTGGVFQDLYIQFDEPSNKKYISVDLPIFLIESSQNIGSPVIILKPDDIICLRFTAKFNNEVREFLNEATKLNTKIKYQRNANLKIKLKHHGSVFDDELILEWNNVTLK